MTKKILVSAIFILFLFILIPMDVHAETYGICVICHGTAKCELCDPAGGADRYGNGYIGCRNCNGTGIVSCGTEVNGDGERIGCGGSGYMADGSVCPACNGSGQYVCSFCHGSGTLECNCRREGHPGLCTVCHGTGWRTVNSRGEGINTTPVYPSDGARVDASNWGTMEYFTYDASRFGTGTTPYEAMAMVGASSTGQFLNIAHGGSGGGSSGGENGGGSSGGGNNNSGGEGGDDNGGGEAGQGGDPGNDSAPEEDPPVMAEPDPRDDEDRREYYIDVPSDSAIAEMADSDADVIWFISREVSEGYIFSVCVEKNDLSPEALQTLKNMTEDDIAAFKEKLDITANGIDFEGGLADDGKGVDLTIKFGPSDIFPIPCVVLLEIPVKPGHDPADLFYCDPDGGNIKVPLRRIDCLSGSEVIVFPADYLYGTYIFTSVSAEGEQDINPGAENPGEDGSDSGYENPGTQTGDVPGTQDDANTPEDETVSERTDSTLPLVLCIIAVIAAVCGIVLFVAKRRSINV